MIATSRIRGNGTIAKAGGEPAGSFLLVPFGFVQVDNAASGESFAFTRTHAAQAVAWFRSIGRRLMIDFEHQSLGGTFSTRADGLAPAAGWVGGLEVRRDGLWAVDVEWTDQAASLLRRGAYKYFSPVIYWQGGYAVEVESLGPVALTNDPAMRRVPALAATTRKAGAGMRAVTVFSGRPVPLIGRADTNGAMDREVRDGEAESSLIRADDLAALKGFLDYAAELRPAIKRFLSESKAAKRDRWMAAADKIMEYAPPGIVGMAAECVNLINEIAEHREKLSEIEEMEEDAATQITSRRAKLTAARRRLVGPSGYGAHAYEREVLRTAASRKCTKLAAIAIVKRERPDLYRQYVNR